MAFEDIAMPAVIVATPFVLLGFFYESLTRHYDLPHLWTLVSNLF